MSCLLLIDDDESFRTPVRIALEWAGHVVTEARHGKEGLDLYDPAKHDLVVTDLIMPECDGLEVIVELRERNPGVKIIAMSAGYRLAPSSALGPARALGAADTLIKPFAVDQLISAVNRLLSRAGEEHCV